MTMQPSVTWQHGNHVDLTDHNVTFEVVGFGMDERLIKYRNQIERDAAIAELRNAGWMGHESP